MKAPTFTFAGGIIGEGLYGRVDLNKYQTGLKTCHNYHVAVEGGAEKRFGTYLVGFTKYHDRPTKLISWRVANDDSYVLEFGDNYCRFIRFGGYVSIPGGHTPAVGNQATNVDGVMEIAMPYSAAQLADLKFTFANDIMYLFHPDHAPREFKRLGLYDWQVVTMNFDPHPAGPTGFAGTYHDETTNDDNYVVEPVPTLYKVSATLSNGIETKATGPLSINADLGHRRTRVELSWNAVPDAVQYTVYKGKNGIYGFIGYTTDLTYTDRNFAPSFDTVPIGDPIPFPAGEWPRVGEFYKQRLVMASPRSEPQGLWLSRPLVINSLTGSVPSQEDDAIKVTLIGRERHTIEYMVELKKFLLFTNTAEWILGTYEDAAMGPATINPVKETAYGIDPSLPPLPIGERILFVQGITGDIRDMGYEFTSDAYKADDLSRLARHIFTNRRIVSWAYAAYPQNLLHCVTNDGALRTMTYVRDHEIWGWSTSETFGSFLGVATVAEIDHDGVYFLIRRTINGITRNFVERVEVNFNSRIEDMVYVDSALSFREELPFTNLAITGEKTLSFTVLGHSWTIGDQLALELYHVDDRANEHLDREYRIEITSVDGSDLEGELIRKGDTLESELLRTTGRAMFCTQTVAGFSHLVGLPELWVLADGKVLKDLEVQPDGSIHLPFSAARIHAGIPYTSVLETLDLDAEGYAGNYQYRAVNDIILRVRNTRGLWAGSSASPRELVLLEPRNLESYYEANYPLDGAYPIPAHAAWELTCGVRVESRDPLPSNILNIIPDLVYGT